MNLVHYIHAVYLETNNLKHLRLNPAKFQFRLLRPSSVVTVKIRAYSNRQQFRLYASATDFHISEYLSTTNLFAHNVKHVSIVNFCQKNYFSDSRVFLASNPLQFQTIEVVNLLLFDRDV